MDEGIKKIIFAIVVGTVTAVISGVVTFTILRLLPPRITGMFLGGAVAGLLCGLVPYFIAKKKNNKTLGTIALCSCIASGLILGILLALPVAIIFSIIIVVKPSQSSTSDAKPEQLNDTDDN